MMMVMMVMVTMMVMAFLLLRQPIGHSVVPLPPLRWLPREKKEGGRPPDDDGRE